MKVRPIALTAGMLLMLTSALIISCSSEPTASAPHLSEREAINIARAYHEKNEHHPWGHLRGSRCEVWEIVPVNKGKFDASAEFHLGRKNTGMWWVTAYTWSKDELYNRFEYISTECEYVVYDPDGTMDDP